MTHQFSVLMRSLIEALPIISKASDCSRLALNEDSGIEYSTQVEYTEQIPEHVTHL